VVAVDAAQGDGPAEPVAELVARSVALRPAPAPLGVVQQLVNTRNRVRGYDLLADLSSAQQWLGLAGGTAAAVLEPAELAELLEFRESVRALLLAHTTAQPPPAEAIEHLRVAGLRSRLRVDFDESGAPALVAADAPGTALAFQGRVVAALAAAPPDLFRRLKACANPDCGWAFYDGSRSRSGAWCVMDVCGARHKMSRYRQRVGQPHDSSS
jgi:predicted RNA-binding Zn ribbon-like protein